MICMTLLGVVERIQATDDDLVEVTIDVSETNQTGTLPVGEITISVPKAERICVGDFFTVNVAAQAKP